VGFVVISERLTTLLALDSFNPAYWPEFFDEFEKFGSDHIVSFHLGEAYRAHADLNYPETRRIARLIQTRILSHETDHPTD
jgi:hypothetical protein